jgi:hypothetical protein
VEAAESEKAAKKLQGGGGGGFIKEGAELNGTEYNL